MSQSLGLRMTAAQFAQMPETSQPVELIRGEVVVPPTPTDRHQRMVGALYALLRELTQQRGIGGSVRLSPLDVYLDDVNVVQPDVFWVGSQNTRCALEDDGCWHGPPDLVVEVVSPGSVKRDKAVKFALYEEAGVREYWIADPATAHLEAWLLRDGAFVRLGVFVAGDVFESTALSGHLPCLWQRPSPNRVTFGWLPEGG